MAPASADQTSIGIAPADGGTSAASRKFAYRARTSEGKPANGIVETATYAAAVKQVKAMGLTVVAIELAEVDARVGRAKTLRVGMLSSRFGKDDVIAFCQQLSVMLRTGVPLADALETFATQAPRKAVATIVSKIRDDVCGGEDFSLALAKWPKIFPPFLVSLVRAAEASGLLPEMMGRVAKELLKQRRTAKQVRGAMIYPGIMAGVAVTVVGIIMVFVLPKFRPLFMAQGEHLPWITKFFMGISDILLTQWRWYIPLAFVAVIGLFLFTRSGPGRAFLDKAKLETPVLGRMYRHLYVSRATSTMATLLGAGVALLDVTQICRTINKNALFNRLWDNLEERVQHGQEMAPAFLECKYVSKHVGAIVNAGEKSGRLPEVLEQTAAFAEEELDASVKACTAMVEPAMIIIMGVLVGGIASSMLLPIFQMSKAVRK